MSRFCGSCGAERSGPEQRFCAACGAALASDVPPPPQPVAPQPAAPQAATPQPAWAAAPAEVDVAVPSARTGGHRRGWATALGSAVVVLALAAAGLVGWQVLGTSGGADSPEQAVSELLTSAVAQDPVGALEMINPGEVEGMDDLYGSARDRAEREGLVTGESITDALDIELEGLELDVDELGDSSARVVLTGGDYSVTFHPDRLPDRLGFVADAYPDGRTWTGGLLEDVGTSLPDLNWENERPEPYVDVVKVDGRWYVSLVGTYLDWLVGVPSADDFREEGVRAPDYDAIGEDVEPIVAEKPEDVFDNLADAVSSQDAEELLANFPADQMTALQPWARTVEDLVVSELQDLDVSLSDVDVDVQEEGDQVRMVVNRGAAQLSYAEADGDSGSVSGGIDGRCLSAVDEDGYDDGACLEGEVADIGVDEFFVVLRKVDGGYQIDPIATAVAYGQDIVDRAPASMIDQALEAIEDEIN
jgi:hypothetical protein